VIIFKNTSYHFFPDHYNNLFLRLFHSILRNFCHVDFGICYLYFCYRIVTSFVFHWSSLISAWIFLLFIPLGGDKYKFVHLINHKQSESMVYGKCNLCCGRRREVEFMLLPIYQRRYNASSE